MNIGVKDSCLKKLSFLFYFILVFSQAADGVGAGNGEALNPKAGHKLICSSKDALKADYLKQLYRHEIYGDPELVKEVGAEVSTAAAFYQQQIATKFLDKKRGPNLAPNLFKNLTKEQLFDGATLFDPAQEASLPQAGDVLLNMTFLNPYNAGSFYSKRGMIHARIVVGAKEDVRGKYLEVLDGGWQRFSPLYQVHSQTIWLRPKTNYFEDSDKKKLVKLANAFEPVAYDNTLTDNLQEYRSRLHQALSSSADTNGDGVESVEEKRAQQLNEREGFVARSNPRPETNFLGFAPFGNPLSYARAENFSGFYCSEAGTDIYSLLGFRLYGEVPFEVITAFSSSGKLPEWANYLNALGGFGASEGKVMIVHKTFFTYFSLLDQAWKKGLVLPEGVEQYDQNFARVMKLNMNSALSQTRPDGSLDGLLNQLNELIAQAETSGLLELKNKAVEVRLQLLGMVQELKVMHPLDPTFNVTKAVNHMFFVNKSYGPNHFLENGEYFELKGVFYNTDLENGYQAKWVVDSDESGDSNASTTLYTIDESAPQAADGTCVKSEEKVGYLPTNP